MFPQLARIRRKPSSEPPSSIKRPDSGWGSCASRNGAVLRTCEISVSGEIHWAHASRWVSIVFRTSLQYDAIDAWPICCFSLQLQHRAQPFIDSALQTRR